MDRRHGVLNILGTPIYTLETTKMESEKGAVKKEMPVGNLQFSRYVKFFGSI